MQRLIICFVLAWFLLPAVEVLAQAPYSDLELKTVLQGGPAWTRGNKSGIVPADLEKALAFNKGRPCGAFYKPASPWTGHLTLPTPDKRLPDGSVFIRLTSSPDAGLIGKTLRLTLVAESEEDNWYDSIRPDVAIDPKALEAAQKKGDRIPVALNGWKSVSVLESLAAARPFDMEVSLADPRVEGDRLIIAAEPVQISGSRKALVRFLGPAEGNYRKVVHFQPATGDFTGAQEYVAIAPQLFRKTTDTIPMSSTRGLEESSANQEGWYLYGSFRGSIFTVDALEPRAALRVGAATTVTGRDEVKAFVAKQQFADLRPDVSRQTLWLPGTGAEANTSDANELWPVGSRGMLVHVFGWRKSSLEKKNSGVILGLVTGHFAFGQARVVQCPFTKEPRWDIEYYQIYVHNPNGIISCAQKWHAYMGNLRRGWMFTVPVSDTIVKLPAQGKINAGGKVCDLYEVMRREFGIMMAVYRTGSGKGTTAVRTDVSCVQDSHAALYGTFKYFEYFLKQTGLEKGEAGKTAFAGNPLVTQFKQLLQGIEANITFHGMASGKWKEFYAKPTAQRYSNIFTIALDSVLSAGTIFPRNANDKMIEMMADHDLPMYNLLTSQIGGRIDGLMPLAPSSPRRR